MYASPHPDATPPSSRMFLFTDIEDSTRLWQSAPEVMQSALARHDAIMRDGIAAYGGEVFKTAGDAFYAAFPDPARGLVAALALQQALGDEPWPAATPIRVRMALHVGEAQARDGDWFGPPLNVVARMLTVARGAQTLVSAAAKSCLDGSRAGAASTLGGAGAGAAVLESHGYFRMKGVDEPVEVFELGLRGKSAFLPPRDTDPVYRVVRDGDLWQPARAIRRSRAGSTTASGWSRCWAPRGPARRASPAATAGSGSATGPAACTSAISRRPARSTASTSRSPRRWKSRWGRAMQRSSSATRSPGGAAAS